METFAVKTEFIFKGFFTVKAENEQQAIEAVEKHCGTVTGNIHTSLSDNCIDWVFDIHPDKVIKSVKQLKNKQV